MRAQLSVASPGSLAMTPIRCYRLRQHAQRSVLGRHPRFGVVGTDRTVPMECQINEVAAYGPALTFRPPVERRSGYSNENLRAHSTLMITLAGLRIGT